MIVSLNRRLFNFTLNTTDRIVQPLLRDKTYMRWNALQFNTVLSLQKVIEAQTSKVLKGMNIPTENSLKSLYKTIYELEEHRSICEQRILELEDKIDSLENKWIKNIQPLQKRGRLL